MTSRAKFVNRYNLGKDMYLISDHVEETHCNFNLIAWYYIKSMCLRHHADSPLHTLSVRDFAVAILM